MRAIYLVCATALCGVAAEESAHHLLHDAYDKDKSGLITATEANHLWNKVVAPNNMKKVEAMFECVKESLPAGGVRAGAEEVVVTEAFHKVVLGALQMKLKGTCLPDTMHHPLSDEHKHHDHEEGHDHHGHDHARRAGVLGEDGEDHDHDHDHDHHVPEYLSGFVAHYTRVKSEKAGMNTSMIVKIFKKLVKVGHAGHDDHSGHAHARSAQVLGGDHGHGHDHGDAEKCHPMDEVLKEAGLKEAGVTDKTEVTGEKLVAALETIVLNSVNNCTRPEEDTCGRTSAGVRWGYTILAVVLTTLIAAVVIIVVVPLMGVSSLVMELLLTFAVGALLGDVFLHNLPLVLGVHGHGDHGHGEEEGHAAHEEEELSQKIIRGRMLVVCGTILFFYFIDYLVQAFTGGKGAHAEPITEKTHPEEVGEVEKKVAADVENGEEEEAPKGCFPGWVPAAKMASIVWVVLLADGVHNLTDGLSIAASFSKSKSLGWTTTLAIALHEIPQEVGDFAIMLAAGLPVSQAVCFNLLSGAGSLGAAMIAAAVASENPSSEDWFMCIASGSFVYLGSTVITPEVLSKVKELSPLQMFLHAFGFCAGVAIMWAIAVTEDHDECGH